MTGDVVALTFKRIEAMTTAPTVPTKAYLEEFFAKIDPTPRGRVIFAIDATASRHHAWDVAAKTNSKLFEAAAGINIQLVYYRGDKECVASRWFTDANSLTSIMAKIMCEAGITQIAKVLAHARKENQREKVDALVLTSDACEENADDLYAQARELGVPVFLFQEGRNERVTAIYREIAHITGGAVAEFNSNAAQRFTDLLRAVAIFAAGGIKALANEESEAARLLLTQIKK
jgi:hypothetical protein